MHVVNIDPIMKPYFEEGSEVARQDTGRWRHERKHFTVKMSGSLVLLWEIGRVKTPKEKGLIIGTCAGMYIPNEGRFPDGDPFRCWHWTFGGLTDAPKYEKTISSLVTIPPQIGKGRPNDLHRFTD